MISQAYVPAVTAAGLIVIGHCITVVVQQPLDFGWLALAGLTVLSGFFTIRVPSVPARLSVSETFVFASVLLFGTCAGTITVALEILVAVTTGAGLRQDRIRILFNLASATLSIWVAGHCFYYLAGIAPLAGQDAELHTLLLPLTVLASSYFLLNSGMVALALAIHRRESAVRIWRANFLSLSANYFGGASLAALFVTYTRTIDLVALSIIVPLLIISYLTFKTSYGRVEDATRHVEEVKRLYLSTIETLATAIDAKDQVTHGHIRRVQQFALGLAREVGVRDKAHLQALEAAALLHDTGKLVVPEHILNKPGKLTRGEFEKMKQHASVGAEILSSIKFPYPVVPIVRHHHENWDGTGYPDGLKGTDIPIGARILAVVDCYDALTSDRPYRPRMTDQEAMAILIQRRGTMYDPLVVDTFVATSQKLASEIVEPPELKQTVKEPIHVVAHTTPTALIRSALTEPVGAMLDSALQRTGASLAILFATDPDRDRLLSLASRTPDGASNNVVSMTLGYGISGWVAVNARAVVNAEPALDFRESPAAREFVKSICIPVWVKGEVVGVLSLYSTDRRGFSEDDKAFLEQVVSGLDAEVPARAFHQLLQARKAVSVSSPTVH